MFIVSALYYVVDIGLLLYFCICSNTFSLDHTFAFVAYNTHPYSSFNCVEGNSFRSYFQAEPVATHHKPFIEICPDLIVLRIKKILPNQYFKTKKA